MSTVFTEPLPDNAKDLYKYLAQYSLNNPVTQEALNLRSTGLPPDVKAALDYESSGGLTQRYEDAAGVLRTQLLQRGMYGGKLPPNAGAMLRAFGPLQSELARSKSQAAASTRLADYQALLSNRQNAQSLFNTGMSNALSAASGLSGLESTSFKNILLSSLLGAGTKALTDPKVFESIVSGVTSLFGGGQGQGADAGSIGDAVLSGILGDKGGSTTADIASSAGTSAIKNILPSLAGGAVAPAIGALAGGGGAALASSGATAAMTSSMQAAAAAELAGMAPLAGPAGAGATAGASGGGIGSAITGFLTNPFTIAAAAAIGVGYLWYKSQAHHKADQWVQGVQNPGDTKMRQIDQALTSGQLDEESYHNIRRAHITDMALAGIQFSSKGSDQTKVIGQWLRDSFFKYYNLEGMDPGIYYQLQQIRAKLR